MTTETDDFQKLLLETGITYFPPEGFVPCPVHENSVFGYQQAYRSPSGNLEFRIRIDSFARREAERKAAFAGMEVEVLVRTDENNLHELAFVAALYNLSGDASRAPHVLDPKIVREWFGADWAANCLFPLAEHDFAPGYAGCALYCIHKSDVADVYLVAVYNKNYLDEAEGENVFNLVKHLPDLRFG